LASQKKKDGKAKPNKKNEPDRERVIFIVRLTREAAEKILGRWLGAKTRRGDSELRLGERTRSTGIDELLTRRCTYQQGMGIAYNGCDLSNFYFAYRVSGYSPLRVGELIVRLLIGICPNFIIVELV